MQRVSERVGIQLGVNGAQPIDVRNRQAVLHSAGDHKSPVPGEWQEAFIDVGRDVGRGLECSRLTFDQDVLLFVTEAQTLGTVQMLLLMRGNLVQNAMDNRAWLCGDDVALARSVLGDFVPAESVSTQRCDANKLRRRDTLANPCGEHVGAIGEVEVSHGNWLCQG